MAHKHNRRRVRPRNRDHSPLDPSFDMLDNLSISSKSSSDSLASLPTATSKQLLLPATLRNSNVSVASRHWHNRYTTWQNRDKAQQREAASIEAEQIKLFGGEPGDDPSLCTKMMEVFEGMDWIDTLE